MQKYPTDLLSKDEIMQVLASVRGVIEQKYKVKNIGLFGSYARGEQHETSDVDLLVEFFPGASLLDLTGLRFYLEERLHHSVDVVPLKALREELKPAILADVTYL
jgi:uncharacterized protein